jgi:hypothetical protein
MRFLPGGDGLPLEDRVVMSTATVSSTADHGVGSLRDVISQAKPGDTIKFAQNVWHKIIYLTSGPIEIYKPLDIEGPGRSKLSIDGLGKQQLFDLEIVKNDTQLTTFSGLTL